MTIKTNTDPKAQRILAAVRLLLAQKGYMGTTISAVAKEAGVSRGLLHYYFTNKDEMLARVLKENMQISILLITDTFNRYNTPEGFARAITNALRSIMENDPAFFNLFFEGLAVARHSQVVNQELASLYGQFRTALEKGLTRAADKKQISPDLPIQGLAAVITGIIDGMGAQLITEPELCRDGMIWESVEQTLVDLLTRTK